MQRGTHHHADPTTERGRSARTALISCGLLAFGLYGAPPAEAFQPPPGVVVEGQPAAPPIATTPGAVPPGAVPPGTVPPAATPPANGAPATPTEPKMLKRDEFLKSPAAEQQLDPGLDGDGTVGFNFEGILWPTALNWLAQISHCSLDWTELPGDYLNLRTQRRYTPEEARDLLNRHLLARGFTLLLDGEVLTAVKISALNPGMVPRVDPEELETRMPHEYVKVSLPLDWLLAEDAAAQLAPMLSTNAKLSPIKSVNRLEAMDAVVNLRDVYAMLKSEQSGRRNDNQALVREFRLKHVRATEVLALLKGILGMEDQGGMPTDPNQMMMMQQMMMQQMQQQAAMGGGGKPPAADPRLIVNSHENSILAHAPPDKMEIIEQTIEALDVPRDGDSPLLQNMERMRVYRLTTLAPEPLVDILTDIGELSPRARVRVDKDQRSIVVFGTLADHLTVQTLVDRLDGETRQFEVIALRRLEADQVAGTITYLLSAEDDGQKKESRSIYRYYSFFDDESSHDKTNERAFRVDADIENNRLLVWANKVELKEIWQLLEKLGEIPPGGSNPERVRMFEARSEQEAAEVLERLQSIWPRLSPNPLELPLIPKPQSAAPEAPAAPSTEDEDDQSRQPDRDNLRPPSAPAAVQAIPPRQLPGVALTRIAATAVRVASVVETPVAPAAATAEAEPVAAPLDLQNPEPAPEDRDEEPDAWPPANTRPAAPRPEAPPPIAVQRLPGGRLMLRSDDTQALDQLESLLYEFGNRDDADFKVFQLKNPNTFAYGIELILEEYFGLDKKEGQTLDWYGDVITTNEKGPLRLSRKRELKFISDEDSLTILVQGATPAQLAIIEDLIAIYDQPPSSDPQAVRQTRIFRLKYSKAQVVSDTVKAVYRDLLSANDPALQAAQQQQQQQQSERLGPSITYNYSRGNNDENKKPDPPQPMKFKGLLAVGVDELSNTVVVSAAGGLMENVSELIKALDEAAKPNTRTEFVRLTPGIDPVLIKAHVDGAFAATRAKFSTSTTGQSTGQAPGTTPAAPPGATPPAAPANGTTSATPPAQ